MDVPPLEDLSSVLQKLINNKDVQTNNASCCKRPVMISPDATSFDSHTDGSSLLLVSQFCYFFMLSYKSVLRTDCNAVKDYVAVTRHILLIFVTCTCV